MLSTDGQRTEIVFVTVTGSPEKGGTWMLLSAPVMQGTAGVPRMAGPEAITAWVTRPDGAIVTAT